MSVELDAPLEGERSKIRAVALPTEHGGWSLTLEPAILGLIVAWSWHGLALACVGMLAFLVRTPLKIVMVDKRRKRWLERTSVALRVSIVELSLIIVLTFLGAIGANQKLWLPLILALPLFGIQLWFDIRSKSRRLLPELCGTIGIGALASAIVLADGADIKLAIGLWVVVGARAIAAIPYVRTQVFRRRGKSVQISHSDIAQIFAVISITIAYYLGVTFVTCLALISLAAVFNIVAVRMPASPAKVVGIQQMFFGFAVIFGTAIAVLN